MGIKGRSLADIHHARSMDVAANTLPVFRARHCWTKWSPTAASGGIGVVAEVVEAGRRLGIRASLPTVGVTHTSGLWADRGEQRRDHVVGR